MTNGTRRVGMRRLTHSSTIALAIVWTATPALGQGATTRVFMRGRPDTVVVRDSTFERRSIVNIRRIDSLLKQQEALPMGSPEFARIQSELQAMIRRALPVEARGGSADRVMIMIGPDADRSPLPALAVPRATSDMTPRGWLGFTAGGLQANWIETDGFYVQHFEYPTVLEVDPESPAAKVGVKFGDVLLAYDGADLRSNAINLTRLLVPGRSVSLKLRREGDMKELSLDIEKAPPALIAQRRAAAMGRMLLPSRTPMPDTTMIEEPRAMVERSAVAAQSGGARAGGARAGATFVTPRAVAGFMMPTGYLGARMSDLDPAAVVALTQQKAARGVLVNEVPVASPAARIGLRGGDIIVGVDDTQVVSMAQLRRELVARSDRAIQLTVVRERKIEKLTYDPR